MESPIRFFKRFGQPFGLLLLIGMATFYFWFDPGRAAFFPPCPFRLLTGLECPGCGSQRCLHQLMHGRVKQAYHYNPLLVLSLPYLITGLMLEYTPLREKYAPLRQRFYGKTASVILGGIIILYWIWRNLY